MAGMIFTIDLGSADGLFSAQQFEAMGGDIVLATELPANGLRTILGLVGQTFGVATVGSRL